MKMGGLGPAWDSVRIVESDLLGGRPYMFDSSRTILYVPRGTAQRALARQEARDIVRDGLAAAFPSLHEVIYV